MATSGKATARPILARDYSFEQPLATTCAFCGIDGHEAVARDGYSLLKYLAPISERCPVATFVGVCQRCLVGRPRGDDERPFLAGDGWLRGLKIIDPGRFRAIMADEWIRYVLEEPEYAGIAAEAGGLDQLDRVS
jgi:hypothetical protein